MKTTVIGAIIATAIATTEGKKENSRDGGERLDRRFDRFAHTWGADDDDDWWSSSSSKSSKGSSKSKGSWGSGKGSWGSGKAGKLGNGAFSCSYQTYYLDINDPIDDPRRVDNGGVTYTYSSFAVYNSRSNVGNTAYDGIFSFSRISVGDDYSCQGSGMLGVGGGSPTYNDQLYISSICDPTVDENDYRDFRYITGGGITGGYGKYRGATGVVRYSAIVGIGTLRIMYCTPNVSFDWGWHSSSMDNSWRNDDDGWNDDGWN